MFIQQLYTGCLSEAAYYIESNSEAAIGALIIDTRVPEIFAKCFIPNNEK